MKSDKKEAIDKLEKKIELEKLKNAEQLKSQTNNIELAIEKNKSAFQKEINILVIWNGILKTGGGYGQLREFILLIEFIFH